MGIIHFIINYEAGGKLEFQKFLERYQHEVERELQGLKIQRYWKIAAQWQANFFMETKTTGKAKRVYEVLKLANTLWPSGHAHWTINGPHENGSLFFECILNNAKDDHPLKWAHLQLGNE